MMDDDETEVLIPPRPTICVCTVLYPVLGTPFVLPVTLALSLN